MTGNAEGPNGRKLKAEVEKAHATIAALEAELRRGHRHAAPFSRDEPKPDPKPPGRRPGQGPWEACLEGGGPGEDRAASEPVQGDLPEVEPVIRRFRTESG